MSDPIVDILLPSMWVRFDIRRKVANDLAKQIRQQIGRELLSKADLYGDKEGVYTAVKALDIREVCQMEES